MKGSCGNVFLRLVVTGGRCIYGAPIIDGKEGKMAVFGTSCYRKTYWKNIYTLKATTL
jgi:hypothetical protein